MTSLEESFNSFQDVDLGKGYLLVSLVLVLGLRSLFRRKREGKSVIDFFSWLPKSISIVLYKGTATPHVLRGIWIWIESLVLCVCELCSGLFYFSSRVEAGPPQNPLFFLIFIVSWSYTSCCSSIHDWRFLGFWLVFGAAVLGVLGSSWGVIYMLKGLLKTFTYRNLLYEWCFYSLSILP